MKTSKHFFRFALSSLLLIQTAWADPKPAVTKEDVEEVKKYASLENGKGNLLTPPRGWISPEVARLRKYVSGIVNDLAGPELSRKKINYVINIYGSSDVNAWVQQMSPAVKESAEAKWKEAHPDQIWPLRAAWSMKDDEKPIYEIGVSTALINALKTKDQVAFVLGHELTHLLEGHTDPAESNKLQIKKWWSSQSHETVADHLGIDKIVGKYELDAALDVMEILHPKREEPVDMRDVLQAAMGSHHAEGVRISALQYYIEFVRKSHANALPRAQVAIPPQLKLSTAGREAPPRPRDPKLLQAYNRLLHIFLSGSVGPNASRNLEDFNNSNRDPLFSGLFNSPDPQSYSELFLHAVRYLNESKGTKVAKMNALFRAMIFLGSNNHLYYTSQDWFQSLSTNDRYEIHRFLLSLSTGEGAWSEADFKAFFKGLPGKSLIYIQDPFFGFGFGQSVLAMMKKVSPTWGHFAEYLSSLELFDRPEKFESLAFVEFLRVLVREGAPESDLLVGARNKMLSSLGSYRDSARLMKEMDRFAVPAMRKILFDKTKNPKRLALIKSVNDAFAVHEAAFNKELLEVIMAGLTKENPEPMDRILLESQLQQLDFKSLSRSEEARALEAYEKHTRSALAFGDSVKPNELSVTADFAPNEWNFLSLLMERAGSDPVKLNDYFRFMITQVNPSFFSKSEIPPEALVRLSKAMAMFGKEDFLKFSQQLTPAEVQIRATINEMQRQSPFMDFDSLIHNSSKHAKKMNLDIRAYYKKMIGFREYTGISPRVNANLLMISQVFYDPSTNPMQKLSLAEFNKLLQTIEVGNYYAQVGGVPSFMLGFPQTASKILVDVLYNNLNFINDLEGIAKTYQRVVKLAGSAFSPDPVQEERFKQAFQQKLSVLPLQKQVQWMKSEALRKALGAEFVGKQVANYVSTAAGKDRIRLKQISDQTMKNLKIQTDWPDAYKNYRENLAVLQKLQPAEISSVFQESQSLTNQAEKGSNLIHAMSAFTTYVQTLSLEEKLVMIEFAMGRSNVLPKQLLNSKPEDTNNIDLKQLFMKLREELKFRDVLERALVMNSLLVGPNGLISMPEGMKMMKTHLLKSISADKRETAETVFDALAKAEGRNITLFMSYALAQKPMGAESATSLSESLVFRSFLDYYGVPGVKLAQYLAFTNEFKDLEAAIADYQDAAMPISYFEALQLLQKRLGTSWDPAKYRVVGIIGSGSVNIAIEYTNLQTGVNEVISIMRDEIEAKTNEDFRRINLLFTELTRTQLLKKKFGFVVGLLNLLKASVSLEFDKEHAFKMQKGVQDLYNREVNGWKIRTVDAYEVMGKGLRMQKALGRSAKKIFKEDPKTYEEALRGFLQVEYGVLRGVTNKRNWIPQALFANPDIHDGQFLIDKNTKTIYVLDFGQDIEITNAEREFAIDILSMVSKGESTANAAELIKKYAKVLGNKDIQIDLAQLDKTLKSGDRMDVFIHLIADVHNAGYDIPLSTVHWVLATNRMIILGEKIRMSPETSLKWIIGMRKLGLPLGVYNAGRDVKETVQNIIKPYVKPPTCEALF